MGSATVTELAKALIEKHEGRRRTPYRDTVGKLTIGVGRNIDDNGLRDSEIDFMLANDIAETQAAVSQLFGYPVGGLRDTGNEMRHVAIIDMYFQLGHYRFRSFKKMIAAILVQDWDTAADEALDSKWARSDVQNRAAMIAGMIRTGKNSS